MSIIDFEIDEIRKLCENVVPNTKIIACTSLLPAPLVRVDIHENQVQRQLTVCLRFPLTDYPKHPILVELKSRTLSDKFLQRLTTLCEKQAQQILGKPQGLHVIRFIQSYLRDNPLCVCYDEIQLLRQELGSSSEIEAEEATTTTATTDQLMKLKQRNSTIVFTATGGQYFYRIKAQIPDEYAQKCAELQLIETNLPAVLQRYLIGQSREIARQCVEPPIRATREELNNFRPAPSLYKALKFCLEATRDFHRELCPICSKTVLPANPADIVLDDSHDLFVERVYCGHLFHQGCLKLYLQEPPFPKGGKLCPAKRRHPRSDASYYLGGGSRMKPNNNKATTTTKGNNTNNNKANLNNSTCGIRLSHDRWVVSVKVAEARWAQKQARERELQEVVEFLS